jgi:signal transduction histidine kinase
MHVGEMLDRKGHQVYAVRPEWPVREAAALIAARNIGATIVTDAAGALVGIISERDLVRCLAEVGAGVLDVLVSDVMTASVVTCAPETTVSEALSLMASHRFRHLPVVQDNAVLGLISIRDVLEFRLEGLEENFASLLRGKRESTRAREVAALAQRAQAEWLAGLSGKMQPALHTIVDQAEYLAAAAAATSGGPGDGRDPAQDLSEIGANGRAALATLDDLVELSLLQSRQHAPAAEKIAIRDLLAGCAEAVRAAAMRKGVTVAVAADQMLPPLSADRRMVGRMVENLLANAVKFTPSGGTVRLAGTADHDGGIRIAVSDSGIGMAPEHLAKVTRPFYQVEGLTTRGGAGAGLGLALVDAMMRAHDGMLNLESRIGIGTTATLRFPLVRTVGGRAEAAD